MTNDGRALESSPAENRDSPQAGTVPDFPPQPPAPLSWRVFRAQENPRKTILAGVFIAVILVIVALGYRNVIMVLFAVLVFALTLNSYFLPITYTFDDKGVTTDKLLFRHTRPWTEFRSFFRTTGGIVVSPFKTWSYLDNFRGIHLLLPKDPQPILDNLAARLPQKTKPSRRPTANG